jgi:hypothetical protein
VIRAKVGSQLSLLGADGRLLKVWEIPYDMNQLVVSKEVVGLVGKVVGEAVSPAAATGCEECGEKDCVEAPAV